MGPVTSEPAAEHGSGSDLVEQFRLAGRRLTPQRAIIAAAFDQTPGHPSAEEIYSHASPQLPGLSLKTVYQTLHELVSLGALAKLDVGTGSARFDIRTDAHHHVVCDECGRVHDVVFDVTGLDLPADIADEFDVDRTDIVVRGRCAHHDDPPVPSD